MKRREFLGLAGFSALALVARPSLGGLADLRRREGAIAKNRLGMVIDVRKCLQLDGCTRCIAACHQLHNVPPTDEPRHEVKWLWKEPFERAFPSERNAYTSDALKGKRLPVLCNHCDNPPCVRVCPTKATWKRDDGIVMMDWHRCIGCRYCMAACPYGSRSFNWNDPGARLRHPTPDYPMRTKGVVEKCTFCEERLARGRPPACVEVCPEHALIFGNLADPHSEVREVLRSRQAMRRRPELGTQPSIYYVI